MSDVVPFQNFKVAWVKQTLVPDLNGVVPTLGQTLKKSIESLDEIAPSFPVSGMKVRKLENDCPDLLSIRSERCQKAGDEKIGVEEMGIGLAGATAVAIQPMWR